MGRIAADAGASSALPAYFFGGKDGLYEAVLERLFARREETLRPVVDRVRARVAAAAPLTQDDLRQALTELVGAYVGFLDTTPAFVRLMAWEALHEGRRAGASRPPHSTAMQEGLEAILDALPGPPRRGDERRQLLITTIGLCFFPYAHDDTMLAGLGTSVRTRGFRTRRIRHVVGVLCAALGERAER